MGHEGYFGNLTILWFLHTIEFSEFDDLHGSHSVGIWEQKVYTHMAIIIGKVHNDLLIHVWLGYDKGPQGWLGITHVF